MNFEKYLVQNLTKLGKSQLIIDMCIAKLRSNDIENICGKTIDDIMRRGFLDYIISKQPQTRLCRPICASHPGFILRQNCLKNIISNMALNQQ